MLFQIAGMLVVWRRLIRTGWRPEIVHAHVYSTGVPALILGRLSRAPVVVSEHYTGFQRGLIRGYDRLTARVAFRHADLVALLSPRYCEVVGDFNVRGNIKTVVAARHVTPGYSPSGRRSCSRVA